MAITAPGVSRVPTQPGEISSAWRDAGHPFVSVTVPPQEVTSGVLQLRVVEFRAGSVTVAGTSAERGDRILRSVRTHEGDRIDSRALSEDIDWLNRVGRRSVKAVFAPGDEFGRSDLTLEVTEGRNPSVFAGWSDTGSRATGTQRIFAGISAWIPELNDTTLDYQLTGSPDLWANPRRIVPATGDYPQYVSHSARLVIPTWPRQALEISPGWVATRETPGALVAIENATFELPVIYRSAVSNILPGVHAGDIYGGVEFKKLYRTTLFGGAVAATGEAGLFQLVLGWANGIEDAHGSTQFDFSLRANPGGVVGGNTGANWASFSGGRVTSVNYLYGSGGVTRVTLLPADLVWVSRASGLLAGQPLPDTERLALGGFYAVRGYDIDDAAVDLGVVWRNELRLTGLTLFGGNGFSDRFSPYLFGDIGHGRDLSSGAARTLGSAGLGFDYSVPGHLSASLAAAYAFSTGAVTGAGSVNVQAQLALRY
jgi:hemolysin activation/secretion protein